MWANFMPVRPMPNYFQSDNSLFDVVVIGGGVVGCAIARRFTLEGARVALLEKAPDILAGASKGAVGELKGEKLGLTAMGKFLRPAG
jgi:NADPH-dependent 2,4-dienoyl-CoA reductase/sulfur reductase-like enzyme